MAETNCRYFSGYKPCDRHTQCDSQCPQRDIPDKQVLFVHLGALGAVVRSTCLLPAIRAKYPRAHLTWVTLSPADQLLRGIDMIDRVVALNFQSFLALQAEKWDVALCLDKSSEAVGLVQALRPASVFGFTANGSGAVVPATVAANELWELGLSNHKKFFVNTKTENQLTAEALELSAFRRDPYGLPLSSEENRASAQRRVLWSDDRSVLIGLNTGCAATIPYKKLSVQRHRELIDRLQSIGEARLVLLGGKEDSARNIEIAKGKDVVLSPTELGLRDGLCSVDACDIVVTGDSLGMHMAIARKKWVVAWFGPTCAQEIDLYDRGVKVRAPSPCSPCWKRSCSRTPMCYDEVDLDEVVDGVHQGLQWLKRYSSYKQPSSAMPSSPSP
jgi:heptosyltransferase-2